MKSDEIRVLFIKIVFLHDIDVFKLKLSFLSNTFFFCYLVDVRASMAGLLAYRIRCGMVAVGMDS